MRGLKLRQIEIFCELARQGSLSSTAQQLFLTESAISVAVHELEKQLNEGLFTKLGRRLVLSDRGRELLPQALDLLERADSFGDIGNTSSAQNLAIGATRSVGPHLLPRLVGDFEKYVSTQVRKSSRVLSTPTKRAYELFVQNSEVVLNRLSERTLDVALVEREVLDPALHKEPWLDDPLTIFCRAGHPLLSKRNRLAALASSSWALRETGSGTREIFLRALAPLLPTLNIEVQASDNSTVSEIVARSDRLGCLSRRVIDDELKSGKLAEIKASSIAASLTSSLQRKLWIVTHPQRHMHRTLTQFIQFARTWK